MEQRSTVTALNGFRTDRSAGDPADLLANVRSLADCLEEWAALQGHAIRVPPVAVELRSEAGDNSDTKNQEPLPC